MLMVVEPCWTDLERLWARAQYPTATIVWTVPRVGTVAIRLVRVARQWWPGQPQFDDPQMGVLLVSKSEKTPQA